MSVCTRVRPNCEKLFPVAMMTLVFAAPIPAHPQSGTGTTEKIRFEVASVTRNKADPSQKHPSDSNFPLGPGDAYAKTVGLFTATNMSLLTYIDFALKVTPDQGQALQARLPEWVKSERFDIQARAQGEPTKDQMRLMLRSLLEERFKMVWHRETQQVPVFALTMARPGVFGPMLQPHPADAACPAAIANPAGEGTRPPPPLTPDGKFPTACNRVAAIPATKPGNFRIGGRNVSLASIASALSFAGNLGRPVLDQTALKRTYDFSLEFTRENSASPSPEPHPVPQDAGPTFLEALKEQMGLKLNATKGLLETVVIDEIQQPSEN